MAKMIFVNEHCYDHTGENQISKKISINADEIIKIEESTYFDNSKSLITFNNGTTISVIDTIEQLSEIINN